VLARGCRGHPLDNIVATCDMCGNYPFHVSFAIVIKDGAGANALDRYALRRSQLIVKRSVARVAIS